MNRWIKSCVLALLLMAVLPTLYTELGPRIAGVVRESVRETGLPDGEAFPQPIGALLATLFIVGLGARLRDFSENRDRSRARRRAEERRRERRAARIPAEDVPLHESETPDPEDPDPGLPFEEE